MSLDAGTPASQDAAAANRPIRVAVVSSGLGHVSRGMETWAESLAQELDKRDVNVTLFRGAGPKKNDYDIVVPCIKRTDRLARLGNLLNHLGGWRVGLGSEAGVESYSYCIRLLSHLRRGYDVVHVQQESSAKFLLRAKKLGLVKSRILFANGQKAPLRFLERVPFIQFLSPYDMEETVKHVPKRPGWRVIPNSVDTNVFTPGDRTAARREFGFANDAFTVISVGMVDKGVKQMDHLVREVSDFAVRAQVPVHLAIAGSHHADSAEIEALGNRLLGNRFSVLYDLPRTDMPDFYRCGDVFVLCSQRESFGLVLAEAMSCGVPVICHSFPIMEWVVGDGGTAVDMKKPGELASALSRYSEEAGYGQSRGQAGLERVRTMFSQDKVATQVIDMYRYVIQNS